MNVYLYLKPNNYDGDSDLLTLDLPANYLDDIMKYVRPIAEQRNTSNERILKDLFKACAYEISMSGKNERKNRKTQKR